MVDISKIDILEAVYEGVMNAMKKQRSGFGRAETSDRPTPKRDNTTSKDNSDYIRVNKVLSDSNRALLKEFKNLSKRINESNDVTTTDTNMHVKYASAVLDNAIKQTKTVKQLDKLFSKIQKNLQRSSNEMVSKLSDQFNNITDVMNFQELSGSFEEMRSSLNKALLSGDMKAVAANLEKFKKFEADMGIDFKQIGIDIEDYSVLMSEYHDSIKAGNLVSANNLKISKKNVDNFRDFEKENKEQMGSVGINTKEYAAMLIEQNKLMQKGIYMSNKEAEIFKNNLDKFAAFERESGVNLQAVGVNLKVYHELLNEYQTLIQRGNTIASNNLAEAERNLTQFKLFEQNNKEQLDKINVSGEDYAELLETQNGLMKKGMKLSKEEIVTFRKNVFKLKQLEKDFDGKFKDAGINLDVYSELMQEHNILMQKTKTLTEDEKKQLQEVTKNMRSFSDAMVKTREGIIESTQGEGGGLLENLFSLVKKFGVQAALLSAGLKPVYDGIQAAGRFGVELQPMEAAMKGLSLTEFPELQAKFKQMALSVGGVDKWNTILQNSIQANNRELIIMAGGLENASRAGATMMNNLSSFGDASIDYKEALKDEMQMAKRFQRQAGMTIEEFNDLTTSIVQDNDMRKIMMRLRGEERRAFVDSIRMRTLEMHQIGMTTEQALAAAKALGKLSGETPKERWKRAARIQATMGAMGVEGGEQVARVVRMGVARSTPEQIAAANESLMRLSEKTAAMMGGTIEEEFMVTGLLMKTEMMDLVGPNSDLAQAILGVSKAYTDSAKEIASNTRVINNELMKAVGEVVGISDDILGVIQQVIGTGSAAFQQGVLAPVTMGGIVAQGVLDGMRDGTNAFGMDMSAFKIGSEKFDAGVDKFGYSVDWLLAHLGNEESQKRIEMIDKNKQNLKKQEEEREELNKIAFHKNQEATKAMLDALMDMNKSMNDSQADAILTQKSVKDILMKLFNINEQQYNKLVEANDSREQLIQGVESLKTRENAR